jgi:ribosomal protein S18 acetylase RimI-like enzyme
MGHRRFYLELPPDHEVPIVGLFPDGHVLRREILPDPTLSRLLYTEVGRDHEWTDRLAWTDEKWMYHFMKPQLQLWVLWAVTQPAGYFELYRVDDDESVEIAYFGLRPQFTGRGMGGRLLACAVKHARQVGSRVLVQTCTRDHPHALPNYQARGFRVVKIEEI